MHKALKRWCTCCIWFSSWCRFDCLQNS